MEGYFWRFTQARAGRVAIVMCGVSRGARRQRRGRSSGWPRTRAGFFRWAALQDAVADTAATACGAGEAFSAGPDHLHVDLGPDCRLEASFGAAVGWPRRALGALGAGAARAGAEPVLAPAPVRGRRARQRRRGRGLVRARRRARLRGEELGPRLPRRRGGGVRRTTSDDDVSVSFAGGPVRVGPARLRGERGGRAARRRRAALPPAGVDDAGRGHLAAARPLRARGWSRSRASPTPRPRTRSPCRCRPSAAWSTARTTTWRASLRVRVTRRGRVVYAGESPLAGLERGG